jgi:hypothetical protein
MRLAVGADLGSIDRGQADTVDLAIQSDVDRLARDHRGHLRRGHLRRVHAREGGNLYGNRGGEAVVWLSPEVRKGNRRCDQRKRVA